VTTNKARELRPNVVLVGTLDTKGKEYAYFRSKVEVLEVDTDINDPQRALAMAQRLHEFVGQ
jgi:uncharacterized protein (UPF0261 family)